MKGNLLYFALVRNCVSGNELIFQSSQITISLFIRVESKITFLILSYKQAFVALSKCDTYNKQTALSTHTEPTNLMRQQDSSHLRNFLAWFRLRLISMTRNGLSRFSAQALMVK